jgi:hypothetical protein
VQHLVQLLVPPVIQLIVQNFIQLVVQHFMAFAGKTTSPLVSTGYQAWGWK